MELGLGHMFSTLTVLALLIFLVTPNKYLGPGLWSIALFFITVLDIFDVPNPTDRWDFWATLIGASACFATWIYKKLSNSKSELNPKNSSDFK